MDNIFNVENGDTLIISMDPNNSSAQHHHQIEYISKLFEDQQLKLMFTKGDVKIDLIKSSNLDDNMDSNLRKDNPGLQKAWEDYQIVKELTKDNNE